MTIADQIRAHRNTSDDVNYKYAPGCWGHDSSARGAVGACGSRAVVIPPCAPRSPKWNQSWWPRNASASVRRR